MRYRTGSTSNCGADARRGVSDTVVEVAWGGGCFVVKQPLPNLAVEDDWPADVERAINRLLGIEHRADPGNAGPDALAP